MSKEPTNAMQAAFAKAVQRLANKRGVSMKTYGKMITAKTEGDLYEKTTGRRSPTLDAAAKKK